MSTQSFVFKGPNSSRDLNNHMAKLVAFGPYKGLMVVPSDPVSLQCGLTAGYGYTDEGVKWEENLDRDLVFNFNGGDANNRRTDLCVARHRYSPVEGSNPVQYVVLEGIPQAGEYFPTAPYGDMQEGDIPLAEVEVPANATSIHETNIFNLARIPTTVELREQLSKSLYYALHNFKLEGWDLTAGITDVTVSPGNGLLCGNPNASTTEHVLTDLRLQSWLTPALDSVTGQPFVVGVHIPLEDSPDFPTKLIFTITTTGSELHGNIKITGKDESGANVIEELIRVDMTATEVQSFTSIHIFSEVATSGIDFVFDDPNPLPNDPTITIEDLPISRIIVVGSPSGNARFKFVVDPSYVLPCNEMVLGTVTTDHNHITDLTPIDVLPGSFITEDLSSQCNGSNKSFSINNNVMPGTELLVMDGSTLHRDPNQSKGYSITGHIITLGDDVPAPDGDNTDFWFRYKPM